LDNLPQSNQHLIIKRDEEAWQSREHQNETKSDKTRVWMDRLHDFDSWSSQSFSEIEGWWHFKFIFKKLSEVFPWIIHWWKGLVLLCVHFLCFWGVALFKMTRNTLSHLGLASPSPKPCLFFCIISLTWVSGQLARTSVNFMGHEVNDYVSLQWLLYEQLQGSNLRS